MSAQASRERRERSALQNIEEGGKMIRPLTACVVVLGPLLMLLPPQPARATPPTVVLPALAVSKTGSDFLTVSVTGSGFGTPGPTSSVTLSGQIGGKNTTLP